MKNSVKRTLQATALTALAAAAVQVGAEGLARAGSLLINANICMVDQPLAVYRTAAGIYNSSSSLLNVYCAVPNDATLVAPKFRVRGYDWDSGGAAFTCTGLVRNSLEQVQWFTGDMNTLDYTGPFSKARPVSFDTDPPLPPELRTVGPSQALVLRCDVPPNSELWNIQVGNGADIPTEF